MKLSMDKCGIKILTLTVSMLFVGCATVAKDYTASTSASYQAGDTSLKYDSTKNQENFKADIVIDPATGKLTQLHVETTATTPEAAIAATAKANAATAALLERLLGLLPAAAFAGS